MNAKRGAILMGEPMGLLIAQTEGALEDVESYRMAVAGAEFNVAVGLARLGHPVAYLTRLGKDPFGRRIVRVLSQNAIGHELIVFSDTHPTGFMLKSKVHHGDPEIFYFRKGSAASELSVQDVAHMDFSGYSHLHLTGILPALTAATRKVTFYLLEKARQSNVTICFDPNLRPQLWPDQKTMIDTINQLAAKADYFLPGQKEGQILCGASGAPEIARFYRNLGCGTVVVKTGSTGAYYLSGEESAFVPGFPVAEVVDTVGAGDGFAAGLISALMEGRTIRDAVRRGNAVGAIQVMSMGDNDGLPLRGQLAKFMKHCHGIR